MAIRCTVERSESGHPSAGVGPLSETEWDTSVLHSRNGRTSHPRRTAGGGRRQDDARSLSRARACQDSGGSASTRSGIDWRDRMAVLIPVSGASNAMSSDGGNACDPALRGTHEGDCPVDYIRSRCEAKRLARKQDTRPGTKTFRNGSFPSVCARPVGLPGVQGAVPGEDVPNAARLTVAGRRLGRLDDPHAS